MDTKVRRKCGSLIFGKRYEQVLLEGSKSYNQSILSENTAHKLIFAYIFISIH